MPSEPALLELDHVSRRLAGRDVLRAISFEVRHGDVLGLLGVNGAGKSTTLAIIAGVLTPDSGRIRFEGRVLDDDGRGRAHHIGWVPEHMTLWDELTVAEALDACARLHGLARNARGQATERELARLELRGVADRLCGQLSLGQKRRVGLAQALLHDPDVLVLDEPGNGLDPVQTARLRAFIAELSPGRGIIVSSHDLVEVEAMCNRVVILHDGAVQHAAKPDGRPGGLDARFRAIAQPSADATA